MLTKCMKQSRAKGFTLTEVVLAIGVVAVLIVVFMAMFIPARRTVQSALTIRECSSRPGPLRPFLFTITGRI